MSGKITNPQNQQQLTFYNLEDSQPPATTTFQAQSAQTQKDLDALQTSQSQLAGLAQGSGSLTSTQAQDVVSLTSGLKDQAVQFTKDHQALLNIAVRDQSGSEAGQAVNNFYQPAVQTIGKAAAATSTLVGKGLDSALNDSGLSNEVQSSVATSIDAANLAGRNSTFTNASGTFAPNPLQNPLTAGSTAASGGGTAAASGAPSGSATASGTANLSSATANLSSATASGSATTGSSTVTATTTAPAGTTSSSAATAGGTSSSASILSQLSSSLTQLMSSSSTGGGTLSASTTSPALSSSLAGQAATAGSGTTSAGSAGAAASGFTAASVPYPAPSQSDVAGALKDTLPAQSSQNINTMASAITGAAGTGQLTQVPTPQTVLTALQGTQVPGVSWDDQYKSAGVVQALYAKGAQAAANSAGAGTGTGTAAVGSGSSSSTVNQSSSSTSSYNLSATGTAGGTATSSTSNLASSTGSTGATPSATGSAGATPSTTGSTTAGPSTNLNLTAPATGTLATVLQIPLVNQSNANLDTIASAVSKAIGPGPLSKVPSYDTVIGAIRGTQVPNVTLQQQDAAARAVLSLFPKS